MSRDTAADTTRPALHPATERVERLREAALDRGDALQADNPRLVSFERDLYAAESLRETAGDRFWVRRRGHAIANILRNATVEIGPDELLVGRPYLGPPTEEEAERLQAAREYLSAQPKAFGQTGHQAVDIPRLLSLGARGIQEEIRLHRDCLDPTDPQNLPKIAFYDAADVALDGLCAYAADYAREAERLAAKTDDPQRAGELEEIAARCRRVPAEPARTFAEALQAVNFVNSTLHWAQGAHLVCPGHPDRWLRPYYERDIAQDRITPAEAQELLDCFNILINETVGRGLAIGTMIGGRNAKGEDVTNDLSYMCLQSVRNVRLSYPGLGICWHEGTPDDLLDFGCEVLSEMGANPAIFNDEVITRGLINAGVAPEDACEYQNSTCVEITPVATSGVWVASPYFNLCQNLLDVLDNAEGFDSFDDLMKAFFDRLGEKIREAVIEQNEKRYSCMNHRTFPLQSCFVRDCVEQGLDIEQGGARYYWIEGSFVGLANLVDSLAVIRKYVFEDERLSIPELLEILEADFEGHEPLRQEFINRVPSYGNDEPEVDVLAVEVADFVSSECAKYDTLFDGSYQPGFFCWIMHERLGSETGATPDGRRAHTPFADGAGPAQGREYKGPTAAVKSTTTWDHTPMLGGLVLNLKFSDSALQSPESREKLAELIRTYMRLGGFESQVNVVSRETLLAAKESPEQYRDLVVRVAGYTDYFTNLTEALQNEIITRTEHRGV